VSQEGGNRLFFNLTAKVGLVKNAGPLRRRMQCRWRASGVCGSCVNLLGRASVIETEFLTQHAVEVSIVRMRFVSSSAVPAHWPSFVCPFVNGAFEIHRLLSPCGDAAAGEDGRAVADRIIGHDRFGEIDFADELIGCCVRRNLDRSGQVTYRIPEGNNPAPAAD